MRRPAERPHGEFDPGQLAGAHRTVVIGKAGKPSWSATAIARCTISSTISSTDRPGLGPRAALGRGCHRLPALPHTSPSQILWIADVYGFALAGLLITMGSLGGPRSSAPSRNGVLAPGVGDHDRRLQLPLGERFGTGS